jgi:hypothetical protein
MEACLATNNICGIQWWQYLDNYREFYNWGLVTLRDNAYDGVQAVQATSSEDIVIPGWKTLTISRGGEYADYGDCITGITTANASVYTSLAASSNAPIGTITLNVR